MSQSQEASANPAEPQPVARSGAEKNGNGRGSQQTGRTSASAQPKQGSQAPSSQKSGAATSQKANGTEASAPPKNSWANIARAGPVNGASADKPTAAPAAAPPAATTGVKLPAGVASGQPTQGSIKFGSIGPAELQQQGTKPAPSAPAPAAANPAAATVPPATAPQASKPVSFAAAASGGTAPKQQHAPPVAQQQQPQHQQQQQQRGPGGGRAPRAQQPVTASMPQGAGFSSQPMATAFLLSPGAPVAYPQAYMLYNPTVSTQQYFAGGFGQSGQYPGFNYGTLPQGGNIPTGPRGAQPVPSMPVPPPPPQVSSGGGASGGAAAHGSYGNAPSSPLPARTGTSATPPPARVRKILRIENPETHEVLNLADIAASKKPEASGGESAAAPAEKDESAVDVASASKFSKDVAIRPKSQEAAPEPKKAEQPAETQPAEEVAKDAKHEVAEKPVVEAAEPVDAKQADDANGELSQPEDSDASSQFATPFESEEFERPLPDDGRKRYNSTFLLSIAPLCKDLPPQIEVATLSALQWVEGMGEKPLAPPRPPERDWKSGSRGPPGGMPGGPPGMRGGRGRGRGNSTGIESDTWERGKALPPMPGNQYGGRGPPPGMRMPSGPLPALHKTGSAYKIGNVVTDDPEEEKAQKALKSTLNKITPQNFEKITAQIIEKIKEREKAKTLSGFIDQIFDKALTETTFAELYAKLVASLNTPFEKALTDDDGAPVQFRRTLLNKCQEEFQRGALAMKAVADREKREHEKPADEQVAEETPKAEAEEGEISEEQLEKLNAAEEAKRQDKAQADAEVKARKRMLGNIIFVGQLYRFGVLTENVMHSCIQQLLEEAQNPRSEDIECLCKLLTTVGRPMDSSQRKTKQSNEDGTIKEVPTRDMMGAYFKRIDVLSKNEDALDSRHRFMLADLIDLRRNSWVLRRQTEGPKKIDDIHRDAAMERSRSQMLDRQSSRGGRDQRGPPRPFDNRLDAPVRTMNRVGSQDSLGQSFRPYGRPAPPPRPAPPSASERPPAPPAKPESSEESAKLEASEGNELSAETIAGKVKGLLAEFYNSRDIKEAVLCVNELVEGKADMANVFESLLVNSLESKDTSWETLQELLKACGDEKIIAQADFEQGARQLLDRLDDLTFDVPKAPAQVGDVLGSLLSNGMVDIKVIAQHILEADAEPVAEGEESMMVNSGVALKALGATLRGLKTAKGTEETAAAWKATGLDFKSYIATADREDAAVAEKFVNDYELAEIL